MQASIDDYLTVYPNQNASVKDVKDKEGKVTVATAKMLTANKGKSRLGASVSKGIELLVWMHAENRVQR